jgi:hypothetical protein
MFDDKSIKVFGSRDKIRLQMIDYAKLYLDIPDISFSKTSYLSYLINILSALSANLFFYNSSIYKEFFLTKAEQPESIYNWASILGYETKLANPAKSDITIQMGTNFNSSVQILLNGRTSYHNSDLNILNKPVEFKAQGYDNNIIFVPENNIEIDLTIDKGRLLNARIKEYRENTEYPFELPFQVSSDRENIFFKISVIQLKDEIVDFTIPELRPREFYNYELNYKGNLAGLILKTKDPETEIWNEWDWESNKNSLYLSDPSKKQFSFRPTDENKLKLYFGNDVIGKQPESSNNVRAIISTTEGSNGNVIAGSIKGTSTIYAKNLNTQVVDSRHPVRINVLNYKSAFGGKDYPSLDEIRYNSIQQISSNKRLVTENDFKNIQNIVDGLPITNPFPILKRSDLKRNEIVLFTNLNYMNEIVPTRNCKIDIALDDSKSNQSNVFIQPRYAYIYNGPNDTTGSVGEYVYEDITGSHNTYTLRAGKDIIIIDDEEFYPLFNMELNTSSKIINYYYMINETYSSITLDGYYSNPVVYPKNCYLKVYDELQYVVRNGENIQAPIEKLEIKFSCNTNVISQIEKPKCYIKLEEGDTLINNRLMESTLNTEDGEIDFTYDLEVIKDIPEGENIFYFEVWGKNITTGKYEKTALYYTTVTVRKNLDLFMYSLAKIKESGLWTIYDVPLLKKSYWDSLVEYDLDNGFVQDVYEKISGFDITSYKMMTDFINLKFSNTFGKLTNLQYNDTKETIRGINVDTLPVNLTESYTDSNGNIVYRRLPNPNWAITDTSRNNPWKYDSEPFIAKYDFNYKDWRFRRLIPNDILKYYKENKDEEYHIYNGFSVVPLTDKEIPLQIKLEIWMDKNVSTTDQALITEIKNELINEMYQNFGYDQPIYISKIIEIVQNIEGVKYCKVLKPEHDIFFNYDIYRDFNEKQLLEYSPQMVMFTKSSIFINLRKS